MLVVNSRFENQVDWVFESCACPAASEVCVGVSYVASRSLSALICKMEGIILATSEAWCEDGAGLVKGLWGVSYIEN